MRLLPSGSALIQLADSMDVVLLDKSAKQTMKFTNEIQPPKHLKIGNFC